MKKIYVSIFIMMLTSTGIAGAQDCVKLGSYWKEIEGLKNSARRANVLGFHRTVNKTKLKVGDQLKFPGEKHCPGGVCKVDGFCLYVKSKKRFHIKYENKFAPGFYDEFSHECIGVMPRLEYQLPGETDEDYINLQNTTCMPIEKLNV